MLDVEANRKAVKYSRKETLARLLWTLARPLFAFSPRPCFGWRSALLRSLGARIGRNVHIYGSAVVYFPWNLEVGDDSAIGEQVLIYNPGKVRIGKESTISHRAHICSGTHDYTKPDMPLVKKPIDIGDQVWLCTESFVGPGVTVGDGVVVGARSSVFADLAPWHVCVGSPAKPVKERVLQNSDD